MSIQVTTIKRLYAKSSNRCAFPNCNAPIILDSTPVGQICHIRARRKKGPRYDASLTAEERDSFPNLLLLCPTCHRLVDSDTRRFTPEVLAEMKRQRELQAGLEMTPQVARDAELLLRKPAQGATAFVRGHGVAVAVGGDNQAPISVHNHVTTRGAPRSRYPSNAIGADANMGGYVDYLFGLGVDYWSGVPDMSAGRLGRKIKREFRLKARTRNHIPVERFPALVDFIIAEILEPSPAGKRHLRNGTKLCRSFGEWRGGERSVAD